MFFYINQLQTGHETLGVGLYVVMTKVKLSERSVIGLQGWS